MELGRERIQKINLLSIKDAMPYQYKTFCFYIVEK
jgi:hypothetical protein